MLWVKILLVLCLVLNLTTSLSYYHRRTHRHRHRHVYKCGFQKCVRRKSPPVCKQWCLMYVNAGYCQQPRYVCCSFREKPGYCSQSQNACAWPFPYYLTQAYQCQHDFNCPSGYKCCYDSCYVHKVCKPCVNQQGTSTYPPKENEATTPDFEETTISTTTQETTTATEELTTQKETTTQETTTEKVVTTEKKTETPTIAGTTTQTTTVDEIEGSGFGSGDIELPEPPAARIKSREALDGFNDDEDFANIFMNFN